MRCGIWTVSGGLKAVCWDEIPGYRGGSSRGTCSEGLACADGWNIGFVLENRLLLHRSRHSYVVCTLAKRCCYIGFILTVCPASWIFWATHKGDGWPCWFKELLWDGGEQKFFFRGLAQGHNCSVICAKCHRTNRWEGKSVMMGQVEQCLQWWLFLWAGENQSYMILLACKPAPWPSTCPMSQLSLSLSRCFCFFLIHI